VGFRAPRAASDTTVGTPFERIGAVRRVDGD
jgi:hypothetical protein